MTKYLSSQPFSVTTAGNKAYGEGYDRIFGNKAEPARLDADGTATPKTTIAGIYPDDGKCRPHDGRNADGYVYHGDTLEKALKANDYRRVEALARVAAQCPPRPAKEE